MAWDNFVGAALDLIHVYKDVMGTECAQSLGIQNIDRISRVEAIRGMARAHIPLAISDSAAWSRDLCATVSKDMIYAFLGLAKIVDDELLKPRYSGNVPGLEIFIDLVEYSVQVSKSLEIITISYPTFSNAGFPSWVRD